MLQIFRNFAFRIRAKDRETNAGFEFSLHRQLRLSILQGWSSAVTQLSSCTPCKLVQALHTQNSYATFAPVPVSDNYTVVGFLVHRLAAPTAAIRTLRTFGHSKTLFVDASDIGLREDASDVGLLCCDLCCSSSNLLNAS